MNCRAYAFQLGTCCDLFDEAHPTRRIEAMAMQIFPRLIGMRCALSCPTINPSATKAAGLVFAFAFFSLVVVLLNLFARRFGDLLQFLGVQIRSALGLLDLRNF